MGDHFDSVQAFSQNWEAVSILKMVPNLVCHLESQ